MCGIFSCYSFRSPVNEAIIKKGLEHLHHRGPDQTGYWLSNHRRVGLGQTRLRINDLSDIQLPLTNADGSIKVVVNAEIYNHVSLRKSLQKKGYKFSTNCDAEVIPHLYEEYGINFINKLRGEFAFVIWDDRQQALFAVRDRFGIKPLYYAQSAESIYFSSEIPALLKLGVVSNAWDREALYDYAHLSLPYAKTLFSGIDKIPPASVLSVRSGKVNVQSYWDIQYASDENIKCEDYIEAVREKLIESTVIRTKADVPVGCYLSGGIDSSALLGMAAAHGESDINAFTIAFDNERVDESGISARTAKHVGVNLNTVLVTEEETAACFRKAVKQACFPMPNTAGIARHLLSKYTHDLGYKAVLSGEGADEIFLGYWGAMIEASEDPRLKTSYALSPALKEKLLAQLPVNRDPQFYPQALSKVKSYLGHIPSWFETQGYFNAKLRGALSASVMADNENYSPYLHLLNSLNVQDKLTGFDNVQLSSYTWIKSFFPNTMLNWIGDRAEMANSIESRQPFLDHELFELMSVVPTTMKIKNGVEKYMLREAVKPYVTDEIYQRKKFMFQAPPLKTLKSSRLYQLVRSTILDGIDCLTVFDKDTVLNIMKYAEETPDLPLYEKAELSYSLTSIASMVILAQEYNLT